MKIAISYTGHVRTLLKVIENHKENILNFQEYDIYLSLWDCWGYGHVLKEYVYDKNDIINDSIRQEIISKLNPKFIEFENYLEIKPELDSLVELQKEKSNGCKVSNVVSMFYKIEKGFKNIKKSNIHYDGVLRIRPDLFFLKPLSLFYPEENTLYTCLEPRWNLDTNGLNDQIGFGNMKTMEMYTSVYSNLRTMWDSSLIATPELNNKINAENYNLIIKDIISKNNHDWTFLHDLLRD